MRYVCKHFWLQWINVVYLCSQVYVQMQRHQACHQSTGYSGTGLLSERPRSLPGRQATACTPRRRRTGRSPGPAAAAYGLPVASPSPQEYQHLLQVSPTQTRSSKDSSHHPDEAWSVSEIQYSVTLMIRHKNFESWYLSKHKLFIKALLIAISLSTEFFTVTFYYLIELV